MYKGCHQVSVGSHCNVQIRKIMDLYMQSTAYVKHVLIKNSHRRKQNNTKSNISEEIQCLLTPEVPKPYYRV